MPDRSIPATETPGKSARRNGAITNRDSDEQDQEQGEAAGQSDERLG
jgi:hypothetical protein